MSFIKFGKFQPVFLQKFFCTEVFLLYSWVPNETKRYTFWSCLTGPQSSIHHCFNFFSLLLNLGKLLMICLQVHRLFIICILLLCFSTEFLFVILSVPNFPSYRTFCKLHFPPNLRWFGTITYYFFYSCISGCTKYRICLHLSSFYSCIQFKRQGYSVLTPSHWNLL